MRGFEAQKRIMRDENGHLRLLRFDVVASRCIFCDFSRGFGAFCVFLRRKLRFFGFCYACNRHILQIKLPIITCKFAARTNELALVLPSY